MGVEFQPFHYAVEDLVKGVHKNALTANTDTLKILLTNQTPDLANDRLLADLVEIAAGNGYTAGGQDVQNFAARIGAVITVSASNVAWTAANGPIGPFQCACLYNSTPAGKPLLGMWDYGQPLTLNANEGFSVALAAEFMLVRLIAAA